jgi:hypothetical protein
MVEAAAVEVADALEFMEVMVEPGAETLVRQVGMMEAAVQVELALAVTGLMGQTIHSVLAMAQVVPLEEVGQ